jgi:cytochrome bd-type quinol oxidase subunit 1
MMIQRDWATPLTIGSFFLLAVTGVLMFFHLDTAWNKAAHEWLSWLLLAGAAAHITANFTAFRRYFSAPKGRAIMLVCAVLLGMSFLPLGGEDDKPPFVAPVKALALAPLPVVAQVAGVSTEEMRARWVAAGLQTHADTDSVASLTGNDLKQQMVLLSKVLSPQH